MSLNMERQEITTTVANLYRTSFQVEGKCNFSRSKLATSKWFVCAALLFIEKHAGGVRVGDQEVTYNRDFRMPPFRCVISNDWNEKPRPQWVQSQVIRRRVLVSYTTSLKK